MNTYYLLLQEIGGQALSKDWRSLSGVENILEMNAIPDVKRNIENHYSAFEGSELKHGSDLKILDLGKIPAEEPLANDQAKQYTRDSTSGE